MIGFLLDNLFFLSYLAAGGIAALVLVFAFLAPFESLLWWKNLHIAPARFVKRLKKFEKEHTGKTPDLFIVYLSGVGVISGDGLEDDEKHFVKKIEKQFPNAAVISDVFPYSPDTNSLSADRFFSRLWKYLEKNRLTKRRNILDCLVMLRNALQVAVATDSRYAPMYNLGTTSLILEGLLRNGYDLKNQKPICFIGYSGGAQIAVGATTYLKEIIHAPVSLITIGGAMTDDPGIHALSHIDYLYSPADPVVRITPWLFWGRMPWNVFSSWHQAVKEGKIVYRNVGNCTHAYKHSYFDFIHRLSHTHATYATKPLETTIHILKKHMPLQSFTQAVQKIRELMHEEKALVDGKHNTILLTHGKKTTNVLVIFHGYTNSPPQFLSLAMKFYQKGFTVYIPRLPKHGYYERYYKKTDAMTATQLVDATNLHIDIAKQLGETVHVMGLSLGGVLATYAAQYRSDVHSAFIIAPFLRFHGWNNGFLGLLRFLPHVFLPWSFGKWNQTYTAYSHFSAKGAGEILYLADGIIADAALHPPKVKAITFLINAADKAVSNDIVYQLQKDWRSHGFHHTTVHEVPKEMKLPHDMIDSHEKDQNTAYVYPLVLDLFFEYNM